MPSRLDLKPAPLDAASDFSDPFLRHRTALEYEQLARLHRAMVIGEMIADGIVWLIRLPRRLAAAWRARSARHVWRARRPGTISS